MAKTKRRKPACGDRLHAAIAAWNQRALSDSETPPGDQAVGWQPIESAPRDGGYFIAGRFTGERKNHDGLVRVDRWHNRSRGDAYDGLGRFNTQFWPATHWQPLPEPPTKDPTT